MFLCEVSDTQKERVCSEESCPSIDKDLKDDDGMSKCSGE